MKQLRSLQGGYPRQQDYLLSIQNELLTMGNAMFASLSMDIVLSGCAITDNGNGTVNIAAGIIYVAGEVVRFDGANNVISDGTKTFIKDAPSTSDPKVFGDGGSKNVYTEIKAIVADKISSTQIAITTVQYNLKSFINDVAASYAQKGEIKDIYDFDGTFLDNFDASGLGVTARWSGWHLMNGNGPTPDAQGRVRLSVGTINNNGVDYIFAHGESDGEVEHALTIPELPEFDIPQKVNDVDRGGNGSLFSLDNKTTIGSNQKHNNMQPYLAVYTVVKIV